MLRRLVVVILMLGMLGTGAELFLLEHTEDFWQWTPLVLFAAALPGAGWLLFAPGAASVRVFRTLMLAFVASGFVGQWLHYRGNLEFDREMHPSDTRLELVRDALGGATPALAPGTMTLFGLLGLVACLRHPKLEAADRAKAPREGT